MNASIPKPQLLFVNKPNNANDGIPWTPTLEEKFHAMVPLGHVPTPGNSRAGTPIPPTPAIEEKEGNVGLGSSLRAVTPIVGAVKPPRQPVINPAHPYYFETKHLPYPSSLFSFAPPIEPKSFAETPYTYVTTPTQFNEMITKLQKAKELAVDLEHHSMRSYQGFLCLMQISTREEDWVVDLLTLREEVRKSKLGGVLADPSIVKVGY